MDVVILNLSFISIARARFRAQVFNLGSFTIGIFQYFIHIIKVFFNLNFCVAFPRIGNILTGNTVSSYVCAFAINPEDVYRFVFCYQLVCHCFCVFETSCPRRKQAD